MTVVSGAENSGTRRGAVENFQEVPKVVLVLAIERECRRERARADFTKGAQEIVSLGV